MAIEWTVRAEHDRLARAIEAFPSPAAVLLGPSHVYVAASAAYRRMVGGRELLGRTLPEVLPELVEQGFLRLIDEVYTTGEPFQGTELPAVWDSNGDGIPEHHVVNVTYQPLPGLDGATEGTIVHVVDVTEQAHTEAALRRTEERLRLATEAAEVGTWDFHPQSGELNWDARCKAIFGLAADAHVDYGVFLERLHPADRERTDAVVQQSLDPAGSGAYDIEYRVCRPDGTTRWVHATGRAFFAGTGSERYAARFVGTVRDVTEARATQDALLESEHRYRALVEVSPQVVWFGRGDGYITYCNPYWYEFTGLTPEQSEGNGWSQAIHPDHRERVLKVWLEAAARGGTYEVEIPFRRASDGTYRWFLARGLPLKDDAGTVVRWVGIAVDIHERKQADAERERLLRELRTERERLQSIFAQAPAAISVSVGPEHRGLLANEQFRRLAGRDPVGKPVRAAFPDLDGQGFFELLDQVYATGEPFVGNEMFVRFDRNGDGVLEEGYFNFVYQPLKDADGNVYGIMSHNVEVTDLVTARQHVEQQAAELEEAQAETEMANDELQHANAELEVRTAEAERARSAAEEANRAKTEFLAAMSHELRTPLNAIGGYTELLEMGIRGPVSDQQKEDLERIRRSQQHLLGLINDILNFAKVEAGQVQYHIEDVPVDETLRDMRTLIEPQVQAASLMYEYRPGDDAVTARADRERMEQIVLNLLSNAVKFTPAGGRVVLGWSAQPEVVEICVEDTGRGIPPDKLDDIFEPFVQVDRYRTEASQQGVGLGLAISRDLARTMNGNLTVRSTEGKGSTFTLSLPRAVSAATTDTMFATEP